MVEAWDVLIRRFVDPALVRTSRQVRKEALGYLTDAQQKLRSRQYFLTVQAEELPSKECGSVGECPNLDHSKEFARLDHIVKNPRVPPISTFQLRIEGFKRCPADKALIFQLTASTSRVNIDLADHVGQVGASQHLRNHQNIIWNFCLNLDWVANVEHKGIKPAHGSESTTLDVENVIRALRIVLSTRGWMFRKWWR
jgi:hypothetical protein